MTSVRAEISISRAKIASSPNLSRDKQVDVKAVPGFSYRAVSDNKSRGRLRRPGKTTLRKLELALQLESAIRRDRIARLSLGRELDSSRAAPGRTYKRDNFAIQILRENRDSVPLLPSERTDNSLAVNYLYRDRNFYSCLDYPGEFANVNRNSGTAKI